jgi:lysophospholipase L1-like esterase
MTVMNQVCSVVLALACLGGGKAAAELFKDGDTVCFLGDSITKSHPYPSMIYAYYLTRFPDRTIHFVNAGVAGDTAGGALGRLQEDVVAKSPSVVVVMLGMNDVGRGNYVAEPSAKQLEGQARSLAAYRANMVTLLGRLRSETSARLILMTPSPFDQTCQNDRNNNQPGCNDALGACAEIVRELAPEYQAELVELHASMTAFNLEEQKNNPAYTIVGPDRVHPGLAGNFMMAWLFLKAQGATALVSQVTFDTAAGQATEVANATVTAVGRKGEGWTFTVLEKALPYPVDARLANMLGKLPIDQELNQETICFKGLAEGEHELLIDGNPVACHTAAEWAEGVNLAFNQAAPQVKQAAAVAAVNEKRRVTEIRLRDYAVARWFLRNRRIDPDDTAAVDEFAETKMAKTGYYEGQVERYRKEWPQRDEVIAQVTALEQEALRARIPVSHEYEIRPKR